MQGIKHIVECHCILPQYRNAKNPVYHKFIVFSIIDDSNTVVPKYAQCNNCDVVHKVHDLCKSEIVAGRDEIRSIATIDDIKLSLEKDVCDVLESYQSDVATFENASFIMQNELWGESIVISKETIDDEISGKRLVFERKDKFKIEPFVYRTTV
tara:strand:- start:21020 stop:21481 length:462 start_codon:yes stop_codon:yes gene_type:complete